MMKMAGRIITVSLLFLAALAGPGLAFHSGGAGQCDGCHSMHNSFGGVANVSGGAFGVGAGPYLLKANDPSGVCLNCHAATDATPTGYHISTSGVLPYDGTTPVEMTPGGDFAWLKKTMNLIISSTAGTTTVPDGNMGQRHGHNIIANDFGYYEDTRLLTAPGGTYPSNGLGCQNCHDPHGQYRRFADGSYSASGLPIYGSGSYSGGDSPVAGVSAVGAYRLLGGANYQPKTLIGNFLFLNNPPDAVVSPDYNRSEAISQTGMAYGRGMSEWCVNCHTDMLNGAYSTGHASDKMKLHPVGNGAKLPATDAAMYNAYISSGILTNTNPAAAFNTLAPFEIGTGDYTALRGYAVTSVSYSDQSMPAAGVSNNVMCLTCHRAHASGFDSAMRWSNVSNFLTVADSSGTIAVYDSSTTDNTNNQGYSVEQQTNAYNGRPATVFSPFQRVLCEKCHASY